MALSLSVYAKPHCQGFNNYDNKVTITFIDDKATNQYTVSDVKLIPSWKGQKYKATSVDVSVNNGVATVTLTFDHLTQFSNPKVELKINGKKTSFKVCQWYNERYLKTNIFMQGWKPRLWWLGVLVELRLRRRAMAVNRRAWGLAPFGLSIPNSYNPSDTSEGFCCIWTFRFERCLQVMDLTILLSFSFAVEWAKIAGYRSTESSLRKACLVRVRHCVAHRTLATALDFARCRHGKMFALSSVCWFSFLKIKYCCPIKLFWTGRKNQVWHLLQESAFWVTLLLPQTKTTMDKSIIFADSRSIVR